MSAGRPKRTRLRAAARPKGARLSPEAVAALQDRLGHVFADAEWLHRAFTHVSAASANDPRQSNQRLEFLGDRVLGLLIAETLMQKHANLREGGLAQRLNALVNRGVCAEVCGRAELAGYLLMGASERESGAQGLESVRADLCEAVIGALYLDGGLKAARAFVLKFWARHLRDVSEHTVDAKTRLQHLALARGLALPAYEVVAREGPDHAPLFRVGVEIGGLGRAQGEGASKQAAEQAAAKALLEQVEDEAGKWTQT